MRGLRGAIRLQLQIVRADRGYLNEILANPFFAIIFLGVVRASGRNDLTSFAIVAPVLMTLWAMGLEISGNIVDSDRHLGILEEVVATPTPFGTVVCGRVLTVTMLSAVAVAETWFVARVGFGVDVTIEHPEVFVATLLVTGLAMTGTALVMAGAFVLAGGARTFQNTMNYPIYLLAGVLVPISFLPQWLRPVGRLIFLSWSADLLRDSLRAAPATDVWLRLGAIILLGTIGFAIGLLVLTLILRRVRELGTIGHT
ncbi:MAG TPA: ABC transporter permease [Acidimicrobiales bacterium]|nr:ABC transporter permease [Acidimicrobiales bacterium]